MQKCNLRLDFLKQMQNRFKLHQICAHKVSKLHFIRKALSRVSLMRIQDYWDRINSCWRWWNFTSGCWIKYQFYGHRWTHPDEFCWRCSTTICSPNWCFNIHYDKTDDRWFYKPKCKKWQNISFRVVLVPFHSSDTNPKVTYNGQKQRIANLWNCEKLSDVVELDGSRQGQTIWCSTRPWWALTLCTLYRADAEPRPGHYIGVD